MNAIYRLSATLTMAVLAMSVFAQQHIGKAIDKFLQDKKSHEYIISNNKNNEYVPEAGKNAMFHEIRFRLIRADIDKLERLRKAFLNDSGKAYFIMMKDAGSGSGETCNIAFGADISKSYTFGTHYDRNYIVLNFRDDSDTTWRWSYALVWYEEKVRDGKGEHNYYSGSIHIIYSRDPKANKEKKENVAVRTTILPDGTVVTYNNENDTKTVIYKNGNIVDDGSDELGDVNSQSKFLDLFGNLRSVFMDAVREHSGIAMETTIANRMLSLCKSKGCLLSKDERALCRTTLTDMSSETYDKYVKSLLKMAADALR